MRPTLLPRIGQNALSSVISTEAMNPDLDPLDRQLLALLKVNARLPLARLARSLGCARSTVQLRLKSLELRGVITGYTLSLARPEASRRIHAIVLVAIDTQHEATVIEALARRHEVDRIFTVSGRYDLCCMVSTESTQELDQLIDRMRGVKGVKETFSTLLLSSKLERPA
jgi:DNA-binding Lrp family transcriptional regulator